MKIAFLIPAIDAMGPNIFTLNLIKGLLAYSDIECEVFHFDRGSKDIKQLKFPVKVAKLDFSSKYSFEGFDILHATMPVPDLYIVKHRLYKEKICITSMHCFMEADLYQRKGKLKGWLQCQLWKFALNKFQHIIVSSMFMKDYYSKKLSFKHTYTVIPYGIPKLPNATPISSAVNEILSLKKQYKLICGCGSLIKRKGFSQLIKYLNHNSDAAVILIGRGEQEEYLRKLALDLGVENRVLFLGFLKDSYIYYPYFDVYCMSSNSEGFGLAMIEAMQMATPIVCSDLEIYKGYFGNNEVGLFEFNNQDSFNLAVDKVLAKKEYYSIQAKKLSDTVFSLENMAQCHYEYYCNLLNK